ncbi:hypothetical protein ACFX13_040142 [Malus domestica]
MTVAMTASVTSPMSLQPQQRSSKQQAAHEECVSLNCLEPRSSPCIISVPNLRPRQTPSLLKIPTVMVPPKALSPSLQLQLHLTI